MVFNTRRCVDHSDKILHALVIFGSQIVGLVFDTVDSVKLFVRNEFDCIRYLQIYEADRPLIPSQMNFSQQESGVPGCRIIG